MCIRDRLCIVKLSVGLPELLAPSIVEVNSRSPSLVVLSVVTVTVPAIVTAPVKVISGLVAASSAVSRVIPPLPPFKVIPSLPVIAIVTISLALPISPVIVTVSTSLPVPSPDSLALILTVSLLSPPILPTVIAPPPDVIVKFAPLSRSISPPVIDKVSPVVSIVVVTLTSYLESPVVVSKVVESLKL